MTCFGSLAAGRRCAISFAWRGLLRFPPLEGRCVWPWRENAARTMLAARRAHATTLSLPHAPRADMRDDARRRHQRAAAGNQRACRARALYAGHRDAPALRDLHAGAHARTRRQKKKKNKQVGSDDDDNSTVLEQTLAHKNKNKQKQNNDKMTN